MSATAIHLLLLILAANSVPVILTRILGTHWGRPIDNGVNFIDQQPLLGASKTWRGVMGAIASCILLAPLLSLSPKLGLITGVSAMLGDVASSFCKRRLKLKPSAQAPLLDQIPEALLPVVAVAHTLSLTQLEIILIPLLFLLSEMVLSVIFYRLGIRKQPY